MTFTGNALDIHHHYHYVFPPYFRNMNFNAIIIDVGELIFSVQTVEVTVYKNAQVIFSFSL
jgi:hypothetical protein